MARSTTGTRKLQAAQTEADLKQAAVRVFARLGYLNAKITDITTEAGRAAGSFYTHFPSKEALLEALLVDMLAQSDQAVLTGDHRTDFSDREAVRWHVRAYQAFLREHHVVMEAVQQAAIVNADFAARLRRITHADRGHLAAHLEEAAANG